MESLFFHPKVVHLPLGLALVMPVLAFGLVAARRARFLPPRSWVIVVALQALLLASAYGAMRAGQSEEERVEDLVGESAIHEHEERAEVFLWGAGIVLVIAAAGVLVPGEVLAGRIVLSAAAGTLVVAGLAVRTGQSGGALVYQHGAAAAYADPGKPATEVVDDEP